MGKRDRLARAARKRQKASVQALGRDVGGVDEALSKDTKDSRKKGPSYTDKQRLTLPKTQRPLRSQGGSRTTLR